MQEVTEIQEPDRKTDRPGIYRTAEGFLINKDNDALELRQALALKREAADDVPQWDDADAMLALLKDAEATLLAHLNVGEELS